MSFLVPESPQEITPVTRRNILDYLLLRRPSFYGRLDLITFLKRVWDLANMPSTDSQFENAEGDIRQHMIRNYDWEEDFLLFTYLNLLECSDGIFLNFLEQCLHPLVLSDPNVLAESLDEFNKHLKPDGFQLLVDGSISGKPIYKAFTTDVTSDDGAADMYEVVLSFAGENRSYVEEVAAFLKAHHVRVFYDKYEEATLWGKDLVEHLDKVYRGNAKYCVMFVSKAYADKIWTTHERRSAFAKAVEEKEEYVLPARFDDTELPGLRSSVSYVDLTKKTPVELGHLILEKLGRV